MKFLKEAVRVPKIFFWLAYVCAAIIVNLLGKDEEATGRKWLCVMGLVLLILLFQIVKGRSACINVQNTPRKGIAIWRWLITIYIFTLGGSVYIEMIKIDSIVNWIFLALIVFPVISFWYSILEHGLDYFHRLESSQKLYCVCSLLLIAAAANMASYISWGSYYPPIFLLVISIGCFLGLLLFHRRVVENQN